MSADNNENLRPIIRITKKKKIVGGHHGGAWKVAYADFVTAMMAFFLVMWIISMDQSTKEKIQEYFADPFSNVKTKAGISRLTMGGKSPISISIGRGTKLHPEDWRAQATAVQRDKFVRTQQKLQGEIDSKPQLKKLAKQVEITITSYGMMIELVEAERSPFFATSSAKLPDATRELLKLMAQELGKLPNPIWIEGHTDATPYGSGAEYTNWELSADRANAARRVMESAGLREHQVSQVRGFADSHLRRPDKPTDASNRRVSIVVLFRSLPDDPEPASATQKEEDEKEGMPAVTHASELKNEALELTMERLHAKDMRAAGEPRPSLGIIVNTKTASVH